MKILFSSILILSMLLLPGAAAAQASQPGVPLPESDGLAAEASIGPAIPVFSGASNDVDPAVAYNSVRQEFFIVWTSEINAATAEIRAQRVARDGSLIGGSISIDSVGINYTPDVAYNPASDRYLVVYIHKYGAVSRQPVGRMVAGDGSLVTPVPLLSLTNTFLKTPRVAYNSVDDQFLVVWSKEVDSYTWDLWGLRVSALGGLILPGPVNLGTGASEKRYEEDLAYNPANNQYLLGYILEGYNDNTVVRTVSSGLGSLGPEMQLTISGLFGKEDRSPYLPAQDEFFVTWHMDLGLYGRRVSSYGAPLGPDGGIQVLANTPLPVNWHGDAAAVPALGYLAVDEENDNPASYAEGNIASKLILLGQDSSPWGKKYMDTSSYRQFNPRLACSSDGACLAAYMETIYDPNSSDIGGRIYYLARNGAALLLPQSGARLGALAQTFTWAGVLPADKYRLQVLKAPACTAVVKSIVTKARSAAVKGLKKYKDYCWRVQRYEGKKAQGWSETWLFTTPAWPEKPILRSPSSGKKLAAYPVVLKWGGKTIPPISTYSLQIAADTLFTALVVDSNAIPAALPTVTFSSGTFPSSTRFYWHVKACNVYGECSPWSARRSFIAPP